MESGVESKSSATPLEVVCIALIWADESFPHNLSEVQTKL
jgi:hypothetical protein